ncbi:MAG: GAF domain-containing protein [Candidatus Acidiferrales bacterium]
MAIAAVSELETLIHKMVGHAAKLDASDLAQVAEAVSRVFSVHADEVAILWVTPDRKFLRFVVPEQLRSVGQLPLTSSTALAARTVREKRAEIVNHFNVVPHASVFEGVRLKEEHGEPIQKIMSAPISIGAMVIGVLQVSRKAKTAKEKPDFSTQNLKQLVSVAALLAPAVALCEE